MTNSIWFQRSALEHVDRGSASYNDRHFFSAHSAELIEPRIGKVLCEAEPRWERSRAERWNELMLVSVEQKILHATRFPIKIPEYVSRGFCR